MVTALNKKDYQKTKILRWYGIDREYKGDDIHWKYQINDVGYKYHMNDVTAAILSAQLKEWQQINSRRKQIVNRYLQEFKSAPGLTLLERKKDRQGANWSFTMLVERKDDSPEVIKVRLKEFKDRTMPLLKLFEKQGLIVDKIDGSPSPVNVFKSILKALGEK